MIIDAQAQPFYPDEKPPVRELPGYGVNPYNGNRVTCAVPENRRPSMNAGLPAGYVGGSLGLRQHAGGLYGANAGETLAPLLQINLQAVAYPAPGPIV